MESIVGNFVGMPIVALVFAREWCHRFWSNCSTTVFVLQPRGMIEDEKNKSRLIQTVNFPINRAWMTFTAHFHPALYFLTYALQIISLSYNELLSSRPQTIFQLSCWLNSVLVRKFPPPALYFQVFPANFLYNSNF